MNRERSHIEPQVLRDRIVRPPCDIAQRGQANGRRTAREMNR